MKLIRLTTEDVNANFKNTFSEDIIIPEFSKIALHSLTTQIDTSQIIIDAQNNEFEFTISGLTRTIALSHGTYDKTNIDNFFTDISTKFNKSLTYKTSEISKQFQASTAQNRFVIQLKTGTVADAVKDLVSGDTNLLIGSKNVKQNLSGGASPSPINIQRDGGTDTTNDSFVFIKSPITKGCGSARARIYSNTDTANGGYIIALLSEPVDANTTIIDPTKIVFGVRFVDTTQPYKIIKNGIETVSTVTPIVTTPQSGVQKGGANMDMISLDVYGGKIYATVSNNKPDAVPPATVGVRFNGLEIDSINYNHITNLYPVIVMVSGNTLLESVQVSTDPFYNTTNNVFTSPENYELGGLPSFNRLTQYVTALTIKDIDLAKSLGYKSPIFTDVKTLEGSAEYKARDPLVFRDVADTYLVVLDNINTDAYDSKVGQHLNILSVIPQFDSIRERLVYSATYPVFLSLNNPYKINLREIRARILKEDLVEISTTGYSQITLLIDN
jgi:hypothetical protein